MSSVPLESALSALLASHASLSLAEGRVQCALTGHGMPAKAEAVASYVGGKRYKLAEDWAAFAPELLPRPAAGAERRGSKRKA